MDTLITVLVLAPLVGFAIYGIDCLGERFGGLRFSPEAEDTLKDLWKYCENELFRSVSKDKHMKKIRRKMNPCIIETALKSALDEIETNGANSKIFIPIEKRGKQILSGFENRNV